MGLCVRFLGIRVVVEFVVVFFVCGVGFVLVGVRDYFVPALGVSLIGISAMVE